MRIPPPKAIVTRNSGFESARCGGLAESWISRARAAGGDSAQLPSIGIIDISP
jgi:hypothetical protein